jgi:hypothetical protein
MRWWIVKTALVLSVIFGLASVKISFGSGAPGPITPTPDPLGTPVMPETASQVDTGRELYFYHCMPCHGDHGQGLTDEWRAMWVEDHQNCWARGCHSGRSGEEGFPIPHDVPPVAGSPQAISRFEAPGDLFDYLVAHHPPQRPGALSEQECWALTAFLLRENNPHLVGNTVGLAGDAPDGPRAAVGVSLVIGSLLLGLLFVRLRE